MAIPKKPKAGTKTVAGRQVTATNAPVKKRTPNQKRADAGAPPKKRMTEAEKAKAKKQKELRDRTTPQSVKDARAARQEALRKKREGKEGKTGGKTGGKTDPKPKVGGGKTGDKKPTKLQVWRQKRRDLSAARKAALAPLVETVKKTRAQAAKIREKFKSRFEAHDKKKPEAKPGVNGPKPSTTGGKKTTTGGKKTTTGGKKTTTGGKKTTTGGKKTTGGTARKPRQGK